MEKKNNNESTEASFSVSAFESPRINRNSSPSRPVDEEPNVDEEEKSDCACPKCCKYTQK